MKPTLVIVDLEATCWKDRPDLVPQMEIIEIGAVRLDRDTANVRDEFQTFVRPARNAVLSEFCRQLTGIRQEQVDAAPIFPTTLELLKLWVGDPRAVTLGSWGRYDDRQLRQDCNLHHLPFPFDDDHMNLKACFTRLRGGSARGLARALKAIGLAFEGTPHRGIDDARNIARVYAWMLAHGFDPASDHEPY